MQGRDKRGTRKRRKRAQGGLAERLEWANKGYEGERQKVESKEKHERKRGTKGRGEKKGFKRERDERAEAKFWYE